MKNGVGIRNSYLSRRASGIIPSHPIRRDPIRSHRTTNIRGPRDQARPSSSHHSSHQHYRRCAWCGVVRATRRERPINITTARPRGAHLPYSLTTTKGAQHSISTRSIGLTTRVSEMARALLPSVRPFTSIEHRLLEYSCAATRGQHSDSWRSAALAACRLAALWQLVGWLHAGAFSLLSASRR